MPPKQAAAAHRRWPWVSLLLALACLLVGVAFLPTEAAREAQAWDFYTSSGLARIEAPRYETWLAERSEDPGAAARLHRIGGLDPAARGRVARSDLRFQHDLHAGRVLPPEDPGYEDWQRQRARFETLLAATGREHFALDRDHLTEALHLLGHVLWHGSAVLLAVNLLILLLAGTALEVEQGHRAAAWTLAAGALGGAILHLVFSDVPFSGAAGPCCAVVARLALGHGLRPVPLVAWAGTTRGPSLPAALLWPVWLLFLAIEVFLGDSAQAGAGLAWGAVMGGLAGGMLAALFGDARLARGVAGPAAGSAGGRASSLEAQAQEAAQRLDIRRATRLYRELVELEPGQPATLLAYLNVTLLGPEEEALQDAALRLLWTKFRRSSQEDLRRAFLQLTQPKVLQALPIDEHLRLARRLVRCREDAAALRVIDSILRDDHLRELYGRQLADCLLGLYTAYARNGMQRLADQVQERLSSFFPEGGDIGGVAPTNRPPSTLLSSLRPTLARLSVTHPDSRLMRPGAGK